MSGTGAVEGTCHKRARAPSKDSNIDQSWTTLTEGSTIDDLAGLDASTYLDWVNRQAVALPRVVEASATISSAKCQRQEEPIGSIAALRVMMSQSMKILPPPSNRHVPIDSCWLSRTIDNFVTLRSYLQLQHRDKLTNSTRMIAVPRMKDSAAWHVFCLGPQEAHGNVSGYFEEQHQDDENDSDSEQEQEQDSNDQQNPQQHTHVNLYNSQLVPPTGYTPTTSLLLQFDQVLTRKLFSHHVQYLCDWKFPLTYARATWIYALLARIEEPWHREECSEVRSLLRECCLRRYNLDLSATTHTDTAAWETLALLNTLIAITGIYYQQGVATKRIDDDGRGDSMNALFVPQEPVKDDEKIDGRVD